MHLPVALGFLQFLGKVTPGLGNHVTVVQKGHSEDTSDLVKAETFTFSVLTDTMM